MANRNTQAPQAPVQAPPPVNVAKLAAETEVSKATRVYVDVPGVPRQSTSDGSLVTVQREKRVDGTLGEFMLAEIRKSKQPGMPDSVTRFSVIKVQGLIDSLGARDITVFTLPA